jgi:hypothetical protein
LYTYDQQQAPNLLYQDVDFLADDAREGRATGTEGERASAKYIARRMSQIGLKPYGDDQTFLQSFDFSSNPHAPMTDNSTGTGYNVIGKIDNPGEEVIVIGAHYDHLGHGGFGSLYVGEPAIHNGADDNASGVAVMLRLAESLRKQPTHSDIIFIAFSGEEYGLLGSNYFTKSTLGMDHQFKFMVNMDMVGRLDEMRGMAVNGVGTSPIWNLVIDEANARDMKLIKSESGTGPSDHSSFYYTETPVLHFFTGQHSDYHKPSDDIEKVNFEGMELISDLILSIVQKADEFNDMKFAKTKEEENTNMSFKVTMGVMPDYLFDGKGMRIDGILEDRPAQKSGLLKGDVVIKLGETEVTDINTYMKALNMHEPGQTVTVKVQRGDLVKEVLLTF